jgi:hypothetical protein
MINNSILMSMKVVIFLFCLLFWLYYFYNCREHFRSLLKVEVLLMRDWRRHQIYSGAAGKHPGAFRTVCRSHIGPRVAATLTVAVHILTHSASSGWA